MNQSSNILIMVIVAAVIGVLTFFKLDLSLGTERADIQYGNWQRMTFEDGTIHNNAWIDFDALPPGEKMDTAKREYKAALQAQGIHTEKITGYGLKVSRKHKFSRKSSAGKTHIFDTEAAAVRYAKEMGIPTRHIHTSNQ